MDTTTAAPLRHRGPSLFALAIVFVVLFLASLVLSTWLAGGEHFPSPFAPGAPEWFARHPAAVLAGAFLQFGASVPLGIYTATIVSRMQFFGLRVAGVHIALYGGLSASVFLALSALIQWVLGQPDVASSAAAARALHQLALATGGFGHVVMLGLLLAGISVTAGLTRRLPRWMMVFGLIVAAIGELSSIGLIFRPAMVLLPLARFPALVWIICAGALLPDSMERSQR
jgi:hypothetical protein